MIKSGQTILASDLVKSLVAGEALTANDACYISSADGKAYKTDADDSTKLDFVGFAQETVSIGGTVNLIHSGHMTGLSGMTIGAEYYVSQTAGAITSTAPTAPVVNVVVGVALSATVLKIRSAYTKTTIFTANGTWTKSPKAKLVKVIGIGQGGGGGRSANGATTGSGGGGSGGGYSEETFLASVLGSTETVTVNGGGLGATSSDSNGADGTDSTFGAWLKAGGGKGGGRQATSSGVGGIGFGVGSAGGAGNGNGTDAVLGGGGGGGGRSGSAGVGLTGGAGSKFGAGGGGGGGASANIGGVGGAQAYRGTTIAGGTGGSAGTTGGTGTTVDCTANELIPGSGGGGGGAGSTTGGVGGVGGKYGGGGGGGGSGTTTSGNGGNGGSGIIAVIEFF